ncbi:MAG: HAMP domain-containing histidine kinase [Bacteroidetes bacterium]|nr:HAMP domain-containing histidine kinase [Bacteroidota bacterium]
MKLSPRAKLTLAILFVVLYMLSVFAWWTYALIDYGHREKNLSMVLYRSDSLHLSGEISHSLISGRFQGPDSMNFIYHGKIMQADTSKILAGTLPRYPNYEVLFFPNQPLEKAFRVEIKKSVVLALNKRLQRRTDGWLWEGTSIVLVLMVIAIFMYLYLDRILTVNQQQNNFLLTVTHELKTPVASAKLAVQTAEKQLPQGSESPKRLLQMADKNLERLGNIMDRVLMATRLETNRNIYSAQPIVLEELVHHTLEELKHSLPDTAVVDTQLEKDLAITGDWQMLTMALSNLISNAVKYSKTGEEKITIRTYTEKGRVAMSVSDLGIGIPSDERQRIFKKFYRIGDEKTRSSSGTGLGLYLVKKILRQHKAIIWSENNVPHGTVFRIVFRNRI